MTKYEKDKISEIYGGAISDIYEYVLEKEKSRSGAGTPKAADIKMQFDYSKDCRESQVGNPFE